MADTGARLRVGDVHTVIVGAMVHGGHALAHVEGQTVFVRHACPGEEAVIQITSASRKIVRADAIEIRTPSADRVEPACVLARPGGCGGCDWQFASLAAQRRWKSDVIRESFARFAHVSDLRVPVEPVAGDADGLGWRHRAHVVLLREPSAAHAVPAFKGSRSSTTHPFTQCPVLTPGLNRAAQGFDGAGIPVSGSDAWLQEGSDGLVGSARGRGDASAKVTHTVRNRRWRIDPRSFWQAHTGMADALVGAVLDSVGDVRGQVWWDLYAGSGLFSAFLGERVGDAGTVHAVEESAQSMREGRRALHDLPQVQMHQAATASWIRSRHERVDGVVLDPPRTGAGADVIRLLCQAAPRMLVYVACDPVALARDAALLMERGYRLTTMRAFDGFPMTHHVECVATFETPEIS